MIPKSQMRAGFTLIEIMLAITIIGLLSTVFYKGFTGYIARTKVATTKQTLRTIQSNIDTYNLDMGHYPESLRELMVKPSEQDSSNWNGPYLPGKDAPKDAWGKPIMYSLTPDGEHEYELYSYGAEGKKAKKSDWIHASH